MTDKMISNSEIQAFKRCRRRWWLSYYRRLAPLKTDFTGPRELGTKMHIALATHYQPGGLDRRATRAVLDELYVEDTVRCGERAELDLEFNLTEVVQELQRELELATIMLEGYFDWVEETGADEDLEVVAAERRVEVTLSVPLHGDAWAPVTFLGKLDIEARRRRDGAHTFLDHKTVGSIVDTTKLLPLDEQMLGYMLLRRVLAPEGVPVTSGLYNMLRKVKRTAAARPPFYARVEAYHGEQELREFWARLHGEVRQVLLTSAELDAGGAPAYVAYPTPNRNCSWDCDWFNVCPMFNDGSDAEGYLAVTAVEGDPYERYDIHPQELIA